MAFKYNMRYEVEWLDKNGGIHTYIVYARSAVKAEDKAAEVLSAKPEFDCIECVDLDD